VLKSPPAADQDPHEKSGDWGRGATPGMQRSAGHRRQQAWVAERLLMSARRVVAFKSMAV